MALLEAYPTLPSPLLCQVELVECGYHVYYEQQRLGGIYWAHNGILLINYDTVLPEEALMHGFSQKKEEQSLCGHFGDGLKITFMGYAREEAPAGYLSGGNHLTFDILNPPGKDTATLTLVRKALQTPVKDLYTYAYTGDLDVKGFLMTNFLLFGPPYQVLVTCSRGRILELPGGPPLMLHGVAASTHDMRPEGNYWKNITCVLQIPTKDAILEYDIGRERKLDANKVSANYPFQYHRPFTCLLTRLLYQVQGIMSSILRAALVEDKTFFNSCFQNTIQPLINKW